MTDANYHITGSDENGWDVRRAGASRASAHFDKCDDALKRGREMAGRNGVRLILHDEGGQIVSNEAPEAPDLSASSKGVRAVPKMVLNKIGSVLRRG
jgi:hypothetical protein